MDGLWITPEIMQLKSTSAEKLLLARICYRAAGSKDSVCHDSNTELAQAIGIKAQSVSELIQKFKSDQIVTTQIAKEKANVRTIDPIWKFLRPYKENSDSYKKKADGYKEKPDSDYKEFPDSTPDSAQLLSGNSVDPMRKNRIAYPEKPDSLYKDRKPLENLENSSSVDDAQEVVVDAQKKEEQAPPPTPAPRRPIPIPAGKVYGDGRLQAEAIAFYEAYPDQFPLAIYLPFIRWWTQKYQKGKPDLIGLEKWLAMDSWDIETRLDSWNQREIKKALADEQQSAQSAPTDIPGNRTGQGEVIRTEYSKQTFRRSNNRASGVPNP